MNNIDKVTVFVLVVFILAIVYEFRGNITGFVVKEDTTAPEISLKRIDVFSSTAEIMWETDEEAVSYFKIGDNTQAYSRAREFTISVENLAPGKQHSYSISACDERNNCNTYTNSFTTLATDAAAAVKSAEPQKAPGMLTGAVVVNAGGVQKYANTVIFLLMLAIASVVLVSAAVQKIDQNELVPATIRVGIMLDKAEALLREKKHEEVRSIYSRTRHLYENLNAKEKGKHQKRALSVYSELLSHTRAQEANILVDKYLEGKIDNNELGRLRELLES